MLDLGKQIFAWFAGVATFAWGLIADLNLLTALGALATVAAIVDRIMAIRLKRSQKRLSDAQLSQITGDTW